jgi:hypothetical protein
MWYNEWFGNWYGDWFDALEELITVLPGDVDEITIEEMKRREVRLFLLEAINGTNETINFNSGRITEFNSQRNNTYPYAWLESLKVDTEMFTSLAPVDTWDVVLHIAKKDDPGSKAEEYEEIVDQCDEIAQTLNYQINNVASGYKTITMSDVSREPFIKKHADCTTGVILSLRLKIPDKTNVC